MSPFLKTATLALALLLAGCPQASQTESEETAREKAARDEEAILELAGKYIAAYNASDAEALAELFTLRAVRMPPEEPAFSGRSRIQQDFERIFGDTQGEITINVEETSVRGDLAYARGTFATNLRPRGGGDGQQQVGKWVNVLEREGEGPWRISTQIWNTDAP